MKPKSTVYLVATVTQKFSAIIILPVYTRIFNVDEYGYYNLLVNFFLIGTTLGLAGVEFGVIKYCNPSVDRATPGDQSASAKNFTSALVITWTCSLLSWVAFGFIGVGASSVLFPGLNNTLAILITTTAILFMPIMSICLALFQTRGKPTLFTFISVGNFLLTALLTCLSVGVLKLGLVGAASALLCSNLLFTTAAVFISFRMGFLFYRFTRRDIHALIIYSFPLIPHTLVLQASAFSTRVLISNILGIAAASFFNIASYAVNVIDALQTALYRAFLPWYLDQNDDLSADRSFRVQKAMDMFVTVSVAASIVVAIFGADILIFLAPKDFYEAGSLFPLLALSMMVKAPYYPKLAMILKGNSGGRFVLQISLTSTFIGLGLSVIGLISLGMTGVLIAQVIQRGLMSIISTYIVKKQKLESVHFTRSRLLITFFAGCLAVAYAVVTDLSTTNSDGLDVSNVIAKFAILIICFALLFAQPIFESRQREKNYVH